MEGKNGKNLITCVKSLNVRQEKIFVIRTRQFFAQEYVLWTKGCRSRISKEVLFFFFFFEKLKNNPTNYFFPDRILKRHDLVGSVMA